jgi:hypothetical protein
LPCSRSGGMTLLQSDAGRSGRLSSRLPTHLSPQRNSLKASHAANARAHENDGGPEQNSRSRNVSEAIRFPLSGRQPRRPKPSDPRGPCSASGNGANVEYAPSPARGSPGVCLSSAPRRRSGRRPSSRVQTAPPNPPGCPGSRAMETTTLRRSKAQPKPCLI